VPIVRSQGVRWGGIWLLWDCVLSVCVEFPRICFHPFNITFVRELSDRYVQVADFLPSFFTKYWTMMLYQHYSNDAAQFHFSCYVNKRNYRDWAPENPQELQKRQGRVYYCHWPCY
jgi:hypothetical protein